MSLLAVAIKETMQDIPRMHPEDVQAIASWYPELPLWIRRKDHSPAQDVETPFALW